MMNNLSIKPEVLSPKLLAYATTVTVRKRPEIFLGFGMIGHDSNQN